MEGIWKTLVTGDIMQLQDSWGGLYNNNNNNDRLTAFDPGQPG